MRAPIPRHYHHMLDAVAGPLIFRPSSAMPSSNPKKIYAGQIVKIVRRQPDGSWLASLEDDPRVFFSVHAEQLRKDVPTKNFKDYL